MSIINPLQKAVNIRQEHGTIPLLKRSAAFSKNKFARTEAYRTLMRHRYGTAGLLKIGFPKSGNTWVHFLMANSIVGAADRTDDVHFKNLKHWMAGSEKPPTKPPVEGFPKMRGTHDKRGEAMYLGEDTKVVYIVRHPGDVMESFYHWRRDFWKDIEVGTFSEFIRSEHGVQRWVNHVESWEDRWDLLIKFEDLKQDPASQLRGIWSLINKEIDESTIQYAVEQSSFENMSRMEEKYGLKDKEGRNPDAKFMREGESDAGEAYFDAKDQQYLERTAGDLMSKLDYTVGSTYQNSVIS